MPGGTQTPKIQQFSKYSNTMTTNTLLIMQLNTLNIITYNKGNVYKFSGQKLTSTSHTMQIHNSHFLGWGDPPPCYWRGTPAHLQSLPNDLSISNIHIFSFIKKNLIEVTGFCQLVVMFCNTFKNYPKTHPYIH